MDDSSFYTCLHDRDSIITFEIDLRTLVIIVDYKSRDPFLH